MKEHKKTFKIYTLGCKVNQYDSRYLGELLIKQGSEHVVEKADLAIINTCAVTKSAIAKGKRMVNKAKKENPGAKVILMGCWPQAYNDQVQKMEVDLVWGVGKLDDLLAYIQGLLGYQSAGKDKRVEYISQEDRSRYFLKVQDGCEQFCSYCIIPYTRGKIKSRGEKEILKEVKGASRAGFEEIIVSGIHLGMYGKDIGADITELLKKMIEIPEAGRIRLSSIEVNEVSDELIKLISSTKKICNHLHIPLQSGSDNTLKAMNRPYKSGDFDKKVKQIREKMPDIAISTDVITGFPGEGEEDFKQTYNFIEKTEFSRLHVFPFSAHKNTPATKMDNQVDSKTAKQRSAHLIELGTKLEQDFKKQFYGQKLDVVVENAKEDMIQGKTEYYFDIEFPFSQVTSYYNNDKEELKGKTIKAIFK
jgi:threonylcarbamoyladenosine tRNA methylthiotransferase MtaB